MLKKGTIVVRIQPGRGDNNDMPILGSIFKTTEDDNRGRGRYRESGVSSPSAPSDHIRHAFEEEMVAYDKGCRHIDDLDQYLIKDNYEMY